MDSNKNLDYYKEAELNLLAKAISELSYEGLIHLSCNTTTTKQNFHTYTLVINDKVAYGFKAKKNIWESLQIEINSITRFENGVIDQNFEHLPSAFMFFKDIQPLLEINDITLAHFTEEMHQSLSVDLKIIEKNSLVTIAQIADMPSIKIQSYLHGHPKILLNKGRIGFNAHDNKQYGPEHEPLIGLWIILVKKSIVQKALIPKNTNEKDVIFEELLTSKEKEHLIDFLRIRNLALRDFELFPVHPWQLENIVKIQFVRELAQQNIIIWNEIKTKFVPQISLRTLTAQDSNFPFDLKLALNILNTSAYRGLSFDGVKMGPILSNFLEDIIQNDKFLTVSKTNILSEITGAVTIEKDFSYIEAAPYRYHELLGFVARKSNSRAIMTGALFHTDKNGKSLIGEYIRRSNKSARQWILAYAKTVILPLYHLQLQHGIGLVSHGQNIMLELKDYFPEAMLLKDFQGDLRFSSINNFSALEKFNIKKLPPEYLIHDLITGHFISVLRFISPCLENEKILDEQEFYQIIRDEIKTYLNEYHPHLDLNHPLSLLREEFERVILNKVRFKMGYADTSERLLPLLGKNLKNPMFLNFQNRNTSNEAIP